MKIILNLKKKAFKFPPGHATKIINFITEIKGDKKLKVNRAMSTEGSSSSSVPTDTVSTCKKKKLCSNEVTRDELYVAVRRQIVKWLRGQSNLNLQENKEYQIIVGPSAFDEGYYVEIECLLCSLKTRQVKYS